MLVGRSRDDIKTFWRWFAQNSHLFPAQGQPDESSMWALLDELKKVHAELVFEFDVRTEPPLFVISANGRRELFPAVLEVVNRAPALPGWKICAFRQRGDSEAEIRMGDFRLGPRDIWFSVEPDGHKTGVNLFVKGLTEHNRQQLADAALVLVDNALGEFAVGVAVGFVEFGPLPHDPEAHGLRPLTELANAIPVPEPAQFGR